MPAKNLTRINDEGTYSHVYNKGLENRVIFNDDEDYAVFLGYIKDYLSPLQDPESIKKVFNVNGRSFRGVPHQPKNYFNQVELIAYSLMPDHFHLVLHQKSRGSLERFARSLSTRYSIYFNKKYQRTGTLFQGPYKSVHVKDEFQLLYLTRYLHLHSAGDYSSYPEYLGLNETLPVNPEIVLSHLAKGKEDYKIFVEKYKLDLNEYELLQKITIEPINDNLERRVLESNVENNPQEKSVISSENIKDEPIKKISSAPGLKTTKRIPELLGAGVIFVLLLAIGVTNVTVSTAKGSLPSPSPSPAVLAETMETTPGAIIEAAVANPTTVEKPKQTVTVELDDGSSTVNIRQKPSSYSKKVGDAKDGDSFEFVSTGSGWYEVKLANGSTGFISATYINAKRSNN